jgi:hypothetical protein
VLHIESPLGGKRRLVAAPHAGIQQGEGVSKKGLMWRTAPCSGRRGGERHGQVYARVEKAVMGKHRRHPRRSRASPFRAEGARRRRHARGESTRRRMGPPPGGLQVARRGARRIRQRNGVFVIARRERGLRKPPGRAATASGAVSGLQFGA